MRQLTGSRDRGFTLIEVVVAIAVLSIGTLAGLRALNQSAHVISQQSLRSIALEVARNRAEELKLTGAEPGEALPREVEMGPTVWQIEQIAEATEVGLVEVTILVSAPDMPGARQVIYVPRNIAQ